MRRQCIPGDFRKLGSLGSKLILMVDVPSTQYHVIEYSPQKFYGVWQNVLCKHPVFSKTHLTLS